MTNKEIKKDESQNETKAQVGTVINANVKKGDLVLADFDKKNNVIKITKLDPKKNKQKSK